MWGPSRQREFEALLEQTLEECARRITEYGKAVRTSRIVESRNFRFPFVLSLAEALAEAWPEAVIVEEGRVPLDAEHFAGAGNVDVVVEAFGSAIAIELKAGTGPRALQECSWDALKLATARASEGCSGAYLVAAAPASDWSRPRHLDAGFEFFPARGAVDHGCAELSRSYAKAFERWDAGRRLGPRFVPAAFSTTSTGKPAEVRFAHPAASDPQPWHKWRLATTRVEPCAASAIWPTTADG